LCYFLLRQRRDAFKRSVTFQLYHTWLPLTLLIIFSTASVIDNLILWTVRQFCCYYPLSLSSLIVTSETGLLTRWQTTLYFYQAISNSPSLSL
jgi:hypothetical protein